MASKNDLYNYSGYSFEEFVDLVLKLQEDNQTLDENLEEANSRVGELLEQVCDLQERISEVLDR